MNLQPILTGNLLQLRPLREDDFESLYSCASDPEIWKLHPQSNRYQRDVFLQFFQGAMDSLGAFAIIDRKTQSLIGSSRYYDFDPHLRKVIIGYTFLVTRCWGGIYNRELKSLMLNHAFQYVDSVYFEIGESNYRSRRAIEKIGAQLWDSAPLDGKPHVIYRITKEQQ